MHFPYSCMYMYYQSDSYRTLLLLFTFCGSNINLSSNRGVGDICMLKPILPGTVLCNTFQLISPISRKTFGWILQTLEAGLYFGHDLTKVDSYHFLKTVMTQIAIRIANYNPHTWYLWSGVSYWEESETNVLFAKMHLNLSSAKYRPFCPKGDELIDKTICGKGSD